MSTTPNHPPIPEMSRRWRLPGRARKQPILEGNFELVPKHFAANSSPDDQNSPKNSEARTISRPIRKNQSYNSTRYADKSYRTVAASEKIISSRCYQLKTGHALTGQYLQWTKSQPSAKCGWCPYQTQTRDRLLGTASRGRANRRSCGQM